MSAAAKIIIKAGRKTKSLKTPTPTPPQPGPGETRLPSATAILFPVSQLEQYSLWQYVFSIPRYLSTNYSCRMPNQEPFCSYTSPPPPPSRLAHIPCPILFYIVHGYHQNGNASPRGRKTNNASAAQRTGRYLNAKKEGHVMLPCV